ncbi:MAG TPA: DUF2946 domain-containing protein [Noviherbaspirillum sp.]|nr:DUF2946 domain-containing protein [Noviherbaspirillum sp.]
MVFSRYNRCITAWIACFAILVAVLAPSISHALNASVKGRFLASSEICSVAGGKSHKAGSAHHHSAPAKDGMHFEHCPFCFTHAAAWGLPPSGEIVIPLVMASAAYPSLFFHSPRPLFAWASAQPRAPPFVS